MDFDVKVEDYSFYKAHIIAALFIARYAADGVWARSDSARQFALAGAVLVEDRL